MIKVDLITGFLGSGKTTFLKKYVSYLLKNNLKVGILENDYGAVNVDVMLLSELEKKGCIVESVAGACDRNCHQRRFKTKLIALAMSGCERVVIEPSGLFDTDEFFDSLREEPLDRWYEIGSVIAIADCEPDKNMSAFSQYMLASECANAGRVVLSRTQLYGEDVIGETIKNIGDLLIKCGCERDVASSVVTKPWDSFSDEDMKDFTECGMYHTSFIKKYRDTEGFSTVYFMNTGLTLPDASKKASIVLKDKQYGNIFRVKGFIKDDDGWYEINASSEGTGVVPSPEGQDIIIVIGENISKDKIKMLFGGSENG